MAVEPFGRVKQPPYKRFIAVQKFPQEEFIIKYYYFRSKTNFVNLKWKVNSNKLGKKDQVVVYTLVKLSSSRLNSYRFVMCIIWTEVCKNLLHLPSTLGYEYLCRKSAIFPHINDIFMRQLCM